MHTSSRNGGETMNRRISVYRLAALTVFAVSLLLSIVRIWVMEKNIEISDITTGNVYFIEKNIETTVFVVFSVCFTVAFIVLGIFLGKKANTVIDSENSPVVFSSALCGFMLLAIGLYYTYQYFTTDRVAFGKLLICVMMIAASVMFLYFSISKNGMKKSTLSLMRIIVCLYAVVRLIVDFIAQNSLPSNSAIVFHILSLIFFMLFMVYEGKSDFGAASMRYYLVTGYLCVFFMMIFALPNLFLTLGDYSMIDSYVLFSANDLVIAFYAFTRVYSVARINADETPAKEPNNEKKSENE